MNDDDVLFFQQQASRPRAAGGGSNVLLPSGRTSNRVLTAYTHAAGNRTNDGKRQRRPPPAGVSGGDPPLHLVGQGANKETTINKPPVMAPLLLASPEPFLGWRRAAAWVLRLDRRAVARRTPSSSWRPHQRHWVPAGGGAPTTTGAVFRFEGGQLDFLERPPPPPLPLRSLQQGASAYRAQ